MLGVGNGIADCGLRIADSSIPKILLLLFASCARSFIDYQSIRNPQSAIRNPQSAIPLPTSHYRFPFMLGIHCPFEMSLGVGAAGDGGAGAFSEDEAELISEAVWPSRSAR